MLLGLVSAQIYKLLKNSIVKRIIVFVDFKIRYMVIVRMVCQTFLALSISAILNLYTMGWQGTYHLYLLNSFGSVGVLGVVFIPIFFFNLLFKNRS